MMIGCDYLFSSFGTEKRNEELLKSVLTESKGKGISIHVSESEPQNKMTTTKLPIYQKGSIRYAVTPEGKALPLIWRSKNSGPYRNSKRSLPESLPYGHYLGKPSNVDQTEIDFVEVGIFETSEGWTRLAS